MTAAPTLIDQIFRSSFRRQTIPGWVDNARMRERLTNARRFVLDEGMSAFLGDLSAQAFVNLGEDREAQARLVNQYRLSSRLPYPTTWIEYDLRPSLARVAEILGNTSIKVDEVPSKEGWLIYQHPKVDTAICALVFSYSEDFTDEEGNGMWTFPSAYSWTVDDATVLPWPRYTFPNGSSSHATLATGVVGYDSDHVGITSGDLLKPQMTPTIANLIKEWTGVVRRMWAFLATVNDLPVAFKEVTASKGFVARARYRKYLNHKVVTLTVPQTEARKVAQSALVKIRRRAHSVRGHWRRNHWVPLSTLCEHEFGEDALTCKSCGGKRIWVPNHQRGDDRQGLTVIDYNVTRGDN